MKQLRSYHALVLLLIFCSYYAGISLFSHTHLVNGSSVVHSHLGGDSEHDHSDAQYAVIDILSQFQSECAVSFCTAGTPFHPLSVLYTGHEVSCVPSGAHPVTSLRGPPQA